MEGTARHGLAAAGTIALVLGALGIWSLARDEVREDVGVPVMIGGDAALDACASTGIARGDGIEVRAGPGDAYPPVDALSPGTILSICGASDERAWRAVVY